VGPFPNIVRLLPREQISTGNTPGMLETTLPVELNMVSFMQVGRVGYLYVNPTCDLIYNMREDHGALGPLKTYAITHTS
jgi:hypothetical protein